MKIITTDAAKQIDQRSAAEFGYPPAILMESAAIHIWQRLRADLATADERLLIVCGPGNNGGDGLAIARYAQNDGYRVSIIDCAETTAKKSELNQMQTAICGSLNLPLYRWQNSADNKQLAELLASHSCIIDAIIGIGARNGGVRERLQPLVEALNQQSLPIYAIDVPSGIGASFREADSAIRATITYTVQSPKLTCFTPLARPFCGTVKVVPIGFPLPLLSEQQSNNENGYFLTAADLPRLYQPLSAFHYKHTRGVVAIYGGGDTTIGAAILAADGANASGGGLLHLFPSAPPAAAAALAVARPAYITHSRPPDGKRSADEHAVPSRCNSLCIGPGWGVTPYTRALLTDLLAAPPIPSVIDADALTILSERVSFDQQSQTLTINDQHHALTTPLSRAVLTPHCAEFARLLGIETASVLEDPLPLLRRVAAQLQAVIVLKSYVSYVASPDGRYAVFDGNEVSLATGGSGDVLSGIIAALLAQMPDRFDAAQAAVLIHHRAAKEARKASGGYYSADLLPRFIASVTLPQEY